MSLRPFTCCLHPAVLHCFLLLKIFWRPPNSASQPLHVTSCISPHSHACHRLHVLLRPVCKHYQSLGSAGLIITVASAGGVFPMPMAPVYATAKSGVIHFTRSVAPRLKKRNIRICALCPQQVDTPLVGRHLGCALHAVSHRCDPPVHVKCCVTVSSASMTHEDGA